MPCSNAYTRGPNVVVGGVFGAGALLVLAATRGEALSSRVNTLVGGVYLLLGIVGLFILSSDVNILALNAADNGLHFASAAVLLAVGLARSRNTSKV